MFQRDSKFVGGSNGTTEEIVSSTCQNTVYTDAFWQWYIGHYSNEILNSRDGVKEFTKAPATGKALESLRKEALGKINTMQIAYPLPK